MAEDDPNKANDMLEKRNRDLAKLKDRLSATEVERNEKVAELEKQLMKAEADKRALVEDKGKAESKISKFEKKLAGGRTARVASDLVGSSGAQVVNFTEQALLDYLIDTFDDSVGKHKVLVKGIPVALGLLYYGIEIAFMKEKPTLGKNIRLTLANVLQNLNLVYLSQAIRQEFSEKKAEHAKMGQAVEEQQAVNDQLAKDLERAKKMLADKGIKLESSAK